MDQEAVDFEIINSVFPGVNQDVEDVAEWLNCDVGQLRFSVSEVSITQYTEVIENLLGSYDRFPKDAARTRKILKALKDGKPQRPIFVDPSDGFIMEGRHRIVAFHLFGATSVPTAFVRVAEPEALLRDKSACSAGPR